jgi:hypothetical protein
LGFFGIKRINFVLKRIEKQIFRSTGSKSEKFCIHKQFQNLEKTEIILGR